MNRYAVGIEYDGSGYSGWQTQQSLRTIQSLVESALKGVAAEPVEVICAGRTDAGVHARWQVAHFDTNVTRPMRGWVMGANTELPRDVSIVWARPVPLHFHARSCCETRHVDPQTPGSRTHGRRRGSPVWPLRLQRLPFIRVPIEFADPA